MKNFIKELYFNNIDPQARYFEQNSYLQKQMSTLSECEQILTEQLTGDEKKSFLDFVNASNIVLSESEIDRFILGFRLGAKFAFDAFVCEDAPYSDLLKDEFE